GRCQMAFAIENLPLKELTIIAEQNRQIFEDFVSFVKSQNYESLHAFVTDQDEKRGKAVIVRYFSRPLPVGVALYDGVARRHKLDDARWLLLGWSLPKPYGRLSTSQSSTSTSRP